MPPRDLAAERDYWNRARFLPGDPGGHYESYFQRANHPQRPLAFWIRYTVFSPRGQPQAAMGELWAVYFDGEHRRVSAVRQAFPLAECSFSPTGLEARVGAAILVDGALHGQTASAAHTINWVLAYSGGQAPLLLLPESMYEGGFPKAKALVGTPNAVFAGRLEVDGQDVLVDGWPGSQNHNWGSRHTDQYAWGQVAGFEDAPEAFLELSTARVRVGPLRTPWMTLLVLRLEGDEFRLNGLLQSVRAQGRFTNLAGQLPAWRFASQAGGLRVSGTLHAPAWSFAGLRYGNPPGGSKICLNSKLARCELLVERPGSPPRRLSAHHQAAFEILCDQPRPDIPLLA